MLLYNSKHTMTEKDELRNKKFLKKLASYSIGKPDITIVIGHGRYDNIVKEWIQSEIFILELSKYTDEEIVKFIDKYKLLFFTPNKCICGHFIVEHCVIENKNSKSRITIGNCCMSLICGSTYAINKGLFSHLKRLRTCKTLIIPKRDLIDRIPGIIDKPEEQFLNEKRLISLKKNNKFVLSLDEFERLLSINYKIVTHYYNLIQTVDDVNNLIETQIYKFIGGKKNSDLMCDYFHKYKINPSNDTDIYEIFYTNDSLPYWKLTKKNLQCSLCNICKSYLLKQIFSENYRYTVFEACLMSDTHLQHIWNVNFYGLDEYNESFFYNINDAICSECFKIKYNPSTDKALYKLYFSTSLNFYFAFNLVWVLIKKELQCTLCHKIQSYLPKQIFREEHHKYKVYADEKEGAKFVSDNAYHDHSKEYIEPFFYNVNDAVCSDCFKIKHNPSTETLIYKLCFESILIWQLKENKLRCTICNNTQMYQLRQIFPSKNKPFEVTEYKSNTIENGPIEDLDDLNYSYGYINECMEKFFYNINDALCSDCYKIKYNPSNDKITYKLCYGSACTLYWNVYSALLTCIRCKEKIFFYATNSQGQNSICKKCFSKKCTKCIATTTIEYDKKTSWTLFLINNNAHEVCKSCISSYYKNKFWLKQFNYGCTSCYRQNFRFPNDPDEKKKICWLCLPKMPKKVALM